MPRGATLVNTDKNSPAQYHLLTSAPLPHQSLSLTDCGSRGRLRRSRHGGSRAPKEWAPRTHWPPGRFVLYVPVASITHTSCHPRRRRLDRLQMRGGAPTGQGETALGCPREPAWPPPMQEPTPRSLPQHSPSPSPWDPYSVAGTGEAAARRRT
ncbi:hypothetical protein PVAP13_3KG037827 [Panicum virgatum]|uniref:Uncharacterized protein n=1 Tax=Panicum virgatum TaxID=38727 RepID=A0A8T0UMC2_PANVG|nr:hypothetical protein PVAP13_3KG037827 [Panicum virgatum]